MKENLAKTYDPKNFEDRIYEIWEKSGAFEGKIDKDKKPFTIIMPPPNITGKLHMGHALDQTIQDILTRYKRMDGYSALWIPGTDHASIATEVKVADKIREEEGITKEELGREEFLSRVWDWKEEYGGSITMQCRKLGDSCDWSKEKFTMDESCNKAVRHFFVELYKKGLIYRGNRLINWCPDCKTSLSDAEVEHEDKNGKYWYVRYPFVKRELGEMIVATSRPETMFGDTAIAVNPKDDRYKDFVGEKVIVPLLGREIEVIADEYPDMEKGTGAVKITPAHDPNDFLVGERANLEIISCIDEDGKMNENAGKYAGLDRFDARKKWVEELEEKGFLVKTEEKVIPSGECYRCHTVIEPMLSEQWFVKMEDLAKPAIDALKKDELEFVPERFEKIYLHWLEGIRDWCISRQLWWGHRIPAWHCNSCGEITVSEDKISCCEKCQSKDIYQDEDVLDTWFSSALWPFSTLGWPKKTKELEYFYPTSVLVTGYDIIFFWVIRMVFASIEATKEVPFKHVYIHGLVRDSEGRKMSKSLGNGIDPLEIIDKYGADALRFMLATGTSPGNDMRFKQDKLESSRNFANKLWNASRFVIMNLKDEDGEFLQIENSIDSANFDKEKLKLEDKCIIGQIEEGISYIDKAMSKFDIGLAGQKIYEITWNKYCDWYIEFVKKRLWGEDEEDKKVARGVLLWSLENILKLLHPFMPFITEEIFSYLPKEEEKSLLIQSSWPKENEALIFTQEVSQIELAMEIIKNIRNIRAEAGAIPSKKLKAIIFTEEDKRNSLENIKDLILDIGNLSSLEISSDKALIPEDAMSGVIGSYEIFIPLEDLVDFKEELARLSKEKKKLESEVKRAKGKLSNEKFTSKAPLEVVEEERKKLKMYEEMLAKLNIRIGQIEKKVG